MAFFKGVAGEKIREQLSLITESRQAGLVKRFKSGSAPGALGSLGFGFLGSFLKRLFGGPPPSITEEDEETRSRRSAEAERTKRQRRRTRRVFSSPGGGQVAQGQGGRSRLFGA